MSNENKKNQPSGVPEEQPKKQPKKKIKTNDDLELSDEIKQKIKENLALKVEREYIYPYTSSAFDFGATHNPANPKLAPYLFADDLFTPKGHPKKAFFVNAIEAICIDKWRECRLRFLISDVFAGSLPVSCNTRAIMWDVLDNMYGLEITRVIDWWVFRADLIRMRDYSTVWVAEKKPPFRMQEMYLETSADLYDFIFTAFDFKTKKLKDKYKIFTGRGEDFYEMLEREADEYDKFMSEPENQLKRMGLNIGVENYNQDDLDPELAEMLEDALKSQGFLPEDESIYDSGILPKPANDQENLSTESINDSDLPVGSGIDPDIPINGVPVLNITSEDFEDGIEAVVDKIMENTGMDEAHSQKLADQIMADMERMEEEYEEQLEDGSIDDDEYDEEEPITISRAINLRDLYEPGEDTPFDTDYEKASHAEDRLIDEIWGE